MNFIAIEKVPDVLVTAMERAEELGLSNLRFFCGDAKSMEEYFAPESLTGCISTFVTHGIKGSTSSVGSPIVTFCGNTRGS